MSIYKFIFSNVISYRLARHIAFWSARILFTTCSATLLALDEINTLSDATRVFLFELKIIVVYCLLPDAAFCYFVIYYLIPKLLAKKKYILFSIIVFSSALINYLIIAGIAYWKYRYEKTPLSVQLGFWFTMSKK